MSEYITNKQLTGKWYLKKRKGWFRSGYDVMVEIKGQYRCWQAFDLSPEFTYWVKATDTDIIELNIKTV